MSESVHIREKGDSHRRDFRAILAAVIEAIDAERAVRRFLSCSEGELRVGDEIHDLDEMNRLIVVGAGKASVKMALAAERILGNRIDEGIVVTRRGDLDGACDLETIEVVEAAHPVPDESSAEAANRILGLAERAGPDDLVLCLISGGGSALTTLPAEGVDLDDLRRTNEQLLVSGADIAETNAIRKHLSSFSGGRLAEAIHPATHITLVLSDVVGSAVDTIASGPTVADTTTFDDARAAIKARGLAESIPSSVLAYLRTGSRGDIDETPAGDSPCFDDASIHIVGDVKLAAEAAADAARSLGWNAAILTTTFDGEAREIGRLLSSIAKEISDEGRPFIAPICLVMGGESTVTVSGHGKGGRNQELALAALAGLRGHPKITVATFATDGIDGPTEAAGAIADRHTWQRCRQLGLTPVKYLRNNDSNTFFGQTGDLVVSGATGSNVNDLVVLFVAD